MANGQLLLKLNLERERREKRRGERENLIHLPVDELILVLTCDSINDSDLWAGGKGAPQAAGAEQAVA